MIVLLEVCWRKFVKKGPRVPVINTDGVGRVVHMFRGSKMQFQTFCQRSPELSCKDVML